MNIMTIMAVALITTSPMVKQTRGRWSDDTLCHFFPRLAGKCHHPRRQFETEQPPIFDQFAHKLVFGSNANNLEFRRFDKHIQP